MAKRTDTPLGAKVIEEKIVDEAAEKKISVGDKKRKSFDDFLAAKREVEKTTLKPTSSELEVLVGLSNEEVQKLQFESKRLVGYEEVNGVKICLVKTLAFMKKKEDLEK